MQKVVLLFKDGTHEIANEQMATAIAKAKANDKKKIIVKDGGLPRVVELHTITDILSLPKFYERFPKKRPPQYKRIEHKGLGFAGIIKKEKDKHIKSIIKGLDNFIARNPDAENAKKLRDLAAETLKQRQTLDNTV